MNVVKQLFMLRLLEPDLNRTVHVKREKSLNYKMTSGWTLNFLLFSDLTLWD